MSLRSILPIALLFSFLLTSCFVSRDQEIEGGVAEFRAWVDAYTNRLPDQTEADWQRAKEDFKFRTETLDNRLDTFSAEMRLEYEQAKKDFVALDEKFNRISEQKRLLMPWKENLLGSYADLNVVNEGNVAEVYSFFLKNVRDKHLDWNENSWNMVNQVLQELNKRKDQVDNNLSTEDEVKIKALQMEFAAIEATGESEN